jgi:hypothetical protein
MDVKIDLKDKNLLKEYEKGKNENEFARVSDLVAVGPKQHTICLDNETKFETGQKGRHLLQRTPFEKAQKLRKEGPDDSEIVTDKKTRPAKA